MLFCFKVKLIVAVILVDTYTTSANNNLNTCTLVNLLRIPFFSFRSYHLMKTIRLSKESKERISTWTKMKTFSKDICSVYLDFEISKRKLPSYHLEEKNLILDHSIEKRIKIFLFFFSISFVRLVYLFLLTPQTLIFCTHNTQTAIFRSSLRLNVLSVTLSQDLVSVIPHNTCSTEYIKFVLTCATYKIVWDGPTFYYTVRFGISCWI